MYCIVSDWTVLLDDGRTFGSIDDVGAGRYVEWRGCYVQAMRKLARYVGRPDIAVIPRSWIAQVL